MLKTRTKIFVALSTLFIWLGFGTLSYHYIERWNWVVSFYFSVTTLTTVGYGDLYPTTDFSRLFTAFYILSGVSVVLASLGIIGSRYLENRERILMDNLSNKNDQTTK
ncbi:MAG: two pore domain potassium channel family protein [Parcubacteria group bacterium]|nr:MAG: two pore domain potassium channel family protein [Parcubacteria group bacterium]